MNRTLRTISLAFLAAFAVLALALGFWNLVRGEWLLSRQDNPRLVLEEQRLHRGQILDRTGIVLAETQLNEEGQYLERSYPHLGVAPAVGYYSLTYGVAGIEAAYDSTLRGDAFISSGDVFLNNLLGRPQYGGDLKTTIDLSIQQSVMDLLADRRGAIIVATVPDGDILAMASAPSFNPNELDDQWVSLMSDDAAPLLNRTTQGVYQPGIIFQTLYMAMLNNASMPMPEIAPETSYYLIHDNGIIPCAATTEEIDSLTDAYIYGCPGPFSAGVEPSDLQQYEMILESFGFTPKFTAGYPYQNSIDANWALTAANLRDTVVGQGDLWISPLQMAAIAGVVAANGALPEFHLIEAVRQPGDSWEDRSYDSSQHGAISQEAAQSLVSLMRSSAIYGSAKAANIDIDQFIYGHAGLALAGYEGRYNASFIGFTYLEDGRAVVVAVVLEGSISVVEAARLGGQALKAAYSVMD